MKPTSHEQAVNEANSIFEIGGTEKDYVAAVAEALEAHLVRIEELENKLQIDCQDCREGDGSCDKLHMPSGTMKMYIANLQEENQSLKESLKGVVEVLKPFAEASWTDTGYKTDHKWWQVNHSKSYICLLSW